MRRPGAALNMAASLWHTVLSMFGFAAGAPDDARSGTSSMLDSALPYDDAQWRARLTREQYDVLRRAGTEPPYSSRLVDEQRDGVYVCAGCGHPLFDARSKFDSGTGWPSFHSALPGALLTSTDYKLLLPRTEYHCARCGGHHGHRFEDGPAPTGQRYCSNGVALRFEPEPTSEGLAAAG
jgi:peptide-methionine (R)-S-oxide reductase